ncbi:hypothetical protein G7046_g8813 [Stylonectria norvegica]|nr:hypothetical protein G7046_g8813 [Stylonectria norvegica]
MADSRMGFAHGLRSGGFSMRLLFSYAFDWITLIIVAGIAAALGHIEPNKRPFSLADPDISFSFTEHEVVPPWLLIVLNAGVPIVIISVVTLIFVPGPTVSKDTPKALIWKRKLWELHVGLAGLALALVSAWFFTESMKNMFGKPRPDLLARCDPDLENAAKYTVGFVHTGANTIGQLYSADICRQKDNAKLDDGFRSYPSGHSSSAAAGLIYTSLFLASKFAVTIPFVVAASLSSSSHSTHAAFPSRMRSAVDPYEPTRSRQMMDERSTTSSPLASKVAHSAKVQSLRRQAAAPPVYLLVITLIPFCLAVFIASSRWFDFRHHGFDILFGFIMGTITGIYSFRYYHLPIREGAGWAWGPRSEHRAFWAGVGVLGYAGEVDNPAELPLRHDTGESETAYPRAGTAAYPPTSTAYPGVESSNPARSVSPIEREPHVGRPFQDVELQRMDSREVVEEGRRI